MTTAVSQAKARTVTQAQPHTLLRVAKASFRYIPEIQEVTTLEGLLAKFRELMMMSPAGVADKNKDLPCAIAAFLKRYGIELPQQ